MRTSLSTRRVGSRKWSTLGTSGRGGRSHEGRSQSGVRRLAFEALEGRWLLSAAAIDTPALYAQLSATFSLNDSNAAKAADLSFSFGPANSNWIPLAGDWTGTGTDTVGLYNRATSTFYLRESNTSGAPDIAFTFGAANSNWIPLAGDWTGSGVDIVGLYNPATSTFYLRNSNTSGSPDLTFIYGPANSNWFPLAGDWTGSGVDSVGLYDPATSTFYLRNSNTQGNPDLAFTFGAANSQEIPLAGDWTGGGVETVGLYDPASSTFYLRDSNTTGSPDLTFSYGSGGVGLLPLTGRWNGATAAPPSGPSLDLADPALENLTQSLFARDDAINRPDMMQILLSVAAENGGVLDATDLGDLKTILANAAALNMPGYVQVLAGDVVNGNPANADYQGPALGNLAVGSSATQLTDLVDKWFLGSDPPLANGEGSFGYASYASDPLFGPIGPAYTDMEQGDLGDCYLISSLGAIAKASPQAIENMFVNNGDGTYTVRFYVNGVADYVTVNTSLPTYDGSPIYEGLGAGNSLWLPLAEKAYAQWNETGNEGRDGTNTYASIEGGWMSDVDAQVLGAGAQDYWNLNSSAQQALIAGMTDPSDAVTIATNTHTSRSSGLVGDHAYMVLGYDSANGTFQLYNPWGVDQPPALSWQQLQANCEGFTVAGTTGSVPFGSAGVASASAPLTAIAPNFDSVSARVDDPLDGPDRTSLRVALEETFGYGGGPGEDRAPAGPGESVGLPASQANVLRIDWQMADLFRRVDAHDAGNISAGPSASAVDALLVDGSLLANV